MPNADAIWSESFRVHSYEVDPHGFAPISTLCNYLQETAANHAAALGFSTQRMLDRGYAWVLGRLHVEMDRYPQWGDAVQVETWHSGVHGLYTTREFLVVDPDGRCIGRGTSAWLIIDVQRRRITRPPRDLRAVDTCSRDRVLPDAFADGTDLPPCTDYERRFPVRVSDLDLNQHVNNARYAEWAVESIPEPFLAGHCLSEIELQFRAESTLGDTIVTQAQRNDALAKDRAAEPSSAEQPSADDRTPDDRPPAPPMGMPCTFVHHLQRAEDETTLAWARTRWTARDGNGSHGIADEPRMRLAASDGECDA